MSASDKVRYVAPWEFTAPKFDGTDIPNVPTAEGEAAGRELARLAKPEIERQQQRFPNGLPPCDDCAFVLGTVPNRSAATVLNAVKCMVECEPFYCHKGLDPNDPNAKPKRLCAGWLACVSTRPS